MVDAPPIMARLVRARRHAGLTQAQLAAALGVTQTAVSYWESGARGIDLQTACDYAAEVGVAVVIEEPAARQGAATRAQAQNEE